MYVTSLLLMWKLGKTNKFSERKTVFYRKVEIDPRAKMGQYKRTLCYCSIFQNSSFHTPYKQMVLNKKRSATQRYFNGKYIVFLIKSNLASTCTIDKQPALPLMSLLMYLLLTLTYLPTRNTEYFCTMKVKNVQPKNGSTKHLINVIYVMTI